MPPQRWLSSYAYASIALNVVRCTCGCRSGFHYKRDPRTTCFRYWLKLRDLILVCPSVNLIDELYFAQNGRNTIQEYINYKIYKKYKLYTDKNPMLVEGINKRIKQRRVHHNYLSTEPFFTFSISLSFNTFSVSFASVCTFDAPSRSVKFANMRINRARN